MNNAKIWVIVPNFNFYLEGARFYELVKSFEEYEENKIFSLGISNKYKFLEELKNFGLLEPKAKSIQLKVMKK